EMGKDISGAGMDSNIIGRHGTFFEPPYTHPKVTFIVVCDLTPHTYGNAIGIGSADFTTRGLADKINWEATYVNGLTSVSPSGCTLSPRRSPLKRPPGWFLVGVGAVAGGFVALEVLRAHEPLALDQGLFACYGRWVPKGWVPYRDLFDSKPPLFLYTWAIGSALPGDPASAMWRFEALWVGATMVLAGVVATRLWGRAAGLAVAALLVLGLWSA